MINTKYIDIRIKYVMILVKGDIVMKTMSITNIRANLYQAVEEVNEYSQPIIITNNRGKNAVLISEDDWNAIQETLYLNSIPGMVESIIAAGEEDLSECKAYDPDEKW